MRFVERDAKALNSASAGAELAAADRRGETIEYRSREHFRRRIPPFERRLIVEVSEIQPAQNPVQRLGRKADVDDDAVVVEVGTAKPHVDDEGYAVQLLRGAENLAAETVAIMK